MTNAYYLNQFISTTLSTAGGIDDSQTTGIKIASTSGVTTDKPGILCLSYSDPIDITKAEWISYTSIDVFNELQGVTRGEEGFSAKAHSNGVTVAFPISRSHINNLNDALIIDGDETNLVEGVISPSGTSTNPSTELVTKSYADGGLVTSLSRQAIINGNFDVWQRSVSDAKSGTTNTFGFTADRWWNQVYSGVGGSPANVAYTASRQSFTLGQTDVPYSPKYFHRLDVTTTSTLGTSESLIRNRYRIEGVHNFAGRKWTLTFYAKADSARNAAVVFVQNFGSGGSPSASVQTLGNSISLTSSWQKFTITVDLPSISEKTLGTAGDDNLEIGFIYYKQDNTTYSLPSGVVGTWATGTFDIAQVQLCAGDVALPFMPKSFEEELRACQRYYEIVSTNVGFCGNVTSGTEYRNYVRFYAIKRTSTPTITWTSNAGINGFPNETVTFERINSSGFVGKLTANSTVNGAYFDYSCTIDAEL